MSISNKTVIITGAAGGIGSALVKAYLELNYNVVANGRNSVNLESMATKLGNPERLLLISGDIGKPETSKKLFAKAIERFNKVDVLINNAGITASIAIQPNAKLPTLLPVLIKGGINQATRALALELSSSNIQVNAIAPGVIDTPLNAIHNAQDRENLAKMSPMGKIGNPQNIVHAVVYLTQSEFVTGTTMIVDGGASTGVW